MSRIIDKILIYFIRRRWKTLWHRCSDNKEYAIRRKRYEGMLWELYEEQDIHFID